MPEDHPPPDSAAPGPGPLPAVAATVADPLDVPLAAYLLAEPFLAGKVVLDIGPRPARAAERLARAGVAEALMADGPGPALSAADGSVDVVLCTARLSAAASDAERHRWLMEIRRVLRTGGFCLLRVAVAAIGGRGPATPADALYDLLRPHFGPIQVVGEVPLAGLSFVLPDLDDVAVNEQLAPIAADPTHLVALCAPPFSPQPWQVPESLLVPLRPAPAVAASGPTVVDVAALRDEVEELAARHQAAALERDALRESLMTAQDQADRHEAALSGLRREAERLLQQAADASAETELARLERDRQVRRAAELERTVEALTAELRERASQLAARDREMASRSGAGT